jgi:L-amino acid N-acyltransferase YncA
MDFTIRQARVEDAAGIAHVQVESWKTTYAGIVPDAFLDDMNTETQTQNWQTWFFGDTVQIFVAEDETGIFGFASGGKIREALGDYDAELYAIYLLRQRQRQHAGRMLSQTLASGLCASGFKSMLVWVLEANPSLSFYKHLGGIQISQKIIEIGGVDLPELAFGWPILDRLI